MTTIQARPDYSLEFAENATQGFGFTVRCGTYKALLSYPLGELAATSAGPDYLEGTEDGFHWRTLITPQHGGFLLETALTATTAITLEPSMILWLGVLDDMDDRQAHTWRQTILRAPTTNQQGLGGNDLPACSLYDHTMQTETICYFLPDRFAWASHRFHDFAMREIMVYRPQGRYGIGLIPNAPNSMFELPAGEHRFAWWFTQRQRTHIPTVWEAQRSLIETVTPLLDPLPAAVEGTISWHAMAENTLRDLTSPDCWITLEGQTGMRAYVRGSSALKRDEARGFELMTQLDVLYPLLVWRAATRSSAADAVIDKLLATLPLFARPEWDFVANGFPRREADGFMDTWYFLENALIKLPWVAYLTGDNKLKAMFFSALAGARTLAHNTRYLFPLFADASDWQPRNSLLNVSVGGLYALGCVLAHQLKPAPDKTDYLGEAAAALQTMHRLAPGHLTHEPQQLSFAAAAAGYLARHSEDSVEWKRIASDFIHTVLRMGYWGSDSAVDFYDPRGMFQACASLSYPAYKENVETILPFAELIAHDAEPKTLMAAFMNLQRCHNYRFFDPYLPERLRTGSCAYVPYEDLVTAEFPHTAKLGKELYGAGEVFWSTLLFDTLASVDDPAVLCLCLDVPCAELRPIPTDRRCLLYNPTANPRLVRVNDGQIIELGSGIRFITAKST